MKKQRACNRRGEAQLANGCRKRGYKRLADAWAALDRAGKSLDLSKTSVRPYRCQACGELHLGHNRWRDSRRLPFLIIDDVEARRDMLLERYGQLIEITWAKSFEAGIEALTLGECGFAEVWLDHDLTPAHYGHDYSDGKTGLDLVRRIVDWKLAEGSQFVVHTAQPARGSMMVQELLAAGYAVRRDLLTWRNTHPDAETLV